MKAEIIKLGTLYSDDRPIKPGAIYYGETLFFEDTEEGHEIEWVKDGDMLIANRCVCTNISWEQLDRMGFVFGALVWIDGKDYLCRCLKVGSRNGAPNEWDALLGKYGEDLWNWKDATFWGQEATSGDAACRMARGYYTSRYFNYYAAPTRLPTLGFRPVLEPLTPDLSETLIGQEVKIFGPGGESVCGHLLDYDDYDLILQPDAKTRFCWGKRLDGQFVVRKNAVIGIRELKN